jgi:hypothetical protein
MSPAKEQEDRPPANAAFTMPVPLSAYERRAVAMTQEKFVQRFTQPFLVLARTTSLVAAIKQAHKEAFNLNNTAISMQSSAEAPLAYICPIRCRPGAPKSSTVNLGRNPDNDIALPVGSVSAVHLQFAAPTGPGRPWSARDMGSKNGTFIDGVRMIPGQPYELHSGAQLEIAQEVCGSFWEPDELWRVLRNPSRLQELLNARPQQVPEPW